ncbi:mitochondrial import inner membrane translocase subunit TIM44 isoform X2 [Daktulosphaira vitifoliae]|uniref:mitochondrial import inner membrane translocase subunit TIM44 isoform X2 n=1 Tax=Daktulosphaira vitifoliae TaxID=58002 RepID=UPI0021AA0F3A|nr:mitochondrial import inner membrane translocase subunit TIM44 isoform X2 [Daktulosphaira vitifoliae]
MHAIWPRYRHIYCNAYFRYYSSTPPQRPNFFMKLINDIRDEMAKNKEMKKNLEQFRAEKKKLEQSDNLIKARQKLNNLESETFKVSQQAKDAMGGVFTKVKTIVDQASQSDLAKKAGQLGENIGKTVVEGSTRLGQSEPIKKLEAISEQIDGETSLNSQVYRPPKTLRKRSDVGLQDTIIVNETETGVTIHKDSKLWESWKKFKSENPFMQKLSDIKDRYDDSDHVLARATRSVTNTFSSVFQNAEMSDVVTTICQVEPDFTLVNFIRQCETDIIPNVLEAMAREDLEILKDWCFEAPYRVISHPINEHRQKGHQTYCKVLDIHNVDVVTGKLMEHGPVLIISFSAQQIMYIKDLNGLIVEGDPHTVIRVMYTWAMCRDINEMNPKAAWKLLDIAANSTAQLL